MRVISVPTLASMTNTGPRETRVLVRLACQLGTGTLTMAASPQDLRISRHQNLHITDPRFRSLEIH